MLQQKSIIRARMFPIGLALSALALLGCATGPTYQTQIDRSRASVSNAMFAATISPGPLRYLKYESLELVVQNKTDKDIEIDWNKTLFLANGQTNGGFMFEGIVYADRNNPKPPDVVLPGQQFRKMIWPNSLTHYSSAGQGGWQHHGFNNGDVGVSLVVAIDGKAMRENLFLSFRQVQVAN